MRQTIRLTRGAYKLLKKRYASVLGKCCMAAFCCLFAAIPALAADNIPAPGSSFSIDSNMTFENQGSLSYDKITGGSGHTLTLLDTMIEAAEINLENIRLKASGSAFNSDTTLRINASELDSSSLAAHGKLILSGPVSALGGLNSITSTTGDINMGYGSAVAPDARLEIRAAGEIAGGDPSGKQFHANSLFADYLTFHTAALFENGSLVSTNRDGPSMFVSSLELQNMASDIGMMMAFGKTAINGGKFHAGTGLFNDSLTVADAAIDIENITALSLTQNSGSLAIGANPDNRIVSDFNLTDTDASIGSLKVEGKTTVTGGSLKAGTLELAGAAFANTQASIDKLMPGDRLELSDRATLKTASDGLGSAAISINDSALDLTGNFSPANLELKNGSLTATGDIRIDIPAFELQGSKISGHDVTMADVAATGQSFLEAACNLTVGNVKADSGSLGLAASTTSGVITGGSLSLHNGASASLYASKTDFQNISGTGSLNAHNLNIGQDLSLAGGTIKLSGQSIVGRDLALDSVTGSLGDFTVRGTSAIRDATLNASQLNLRDFSASGQTSLRADRDIALGNVLVSSGRLTLSSENGTLTGATLHLLDNAITSLEAGSTTFANIHGTGSLTANNLEIRQDLTLTLGDLHLAGQSTIGGNMALTAMNATVGKLDVKGATELKASTLTGRDITLGKGASLDSASAIEAQNLITGADIVLANNAGLLAGNITLGDGHLVLEAGQGQRAVAAVGKFTSGDLTVDANSLLSIGNNTPDWAHMGMNGHGASAALGLWAPFELGAGATASVGAGSLAKSRAAGGNQISFAADSLLITNAEVASRYGAGAISAQTMADANIEAGARLHILHAEKDGLYRVLGENIKVHYNGDAWQGENVCTDSALVRLERLEGDKLGWFQATTPGTDTTIPGLTPPIGPGIDDAGDKGQIPPEPVVPIIPIQPSEPDTPPDQPGTPDKPTHPDNPDQPVNPDNPGQPDTPPDQPSRPDVPDRPTDPDNPGQPSNPDNPGKPDTPPDQPDIPDQPDNPDQPNQPDTPDEPEEPDSPDTPDEPDLPPAQETPAQVYSPGQLFLSRATNFWFIGHDARLAARTIESACRIFALGAVPELTMAANQAAAGAMAARTGQGSAAGLQAINTEGELLADAGDSRHGVALWIMPLYKSVNGQSLSSGYWQSDVNGGLGGVALGGDYTFANALRLGLSFNIGGGYARGGGELADTSNSMSFWGIGAYAGWNWSNLDIAADVAYTSTYNKLTQDLPWGMQMDDLKSDITAWALSAGMDIGWTLQTDLVDIRPHAGARYTHVHNDRYDVRSGGTVLEGKAKGQNVWTFPAGVTFRKEFAFANGWSLRPMLDFAVIPATGDKNARSEVRFTGTDAWMELEDQFMDDITWRGSLGLEVGSDNLSFGLNYSMQAGMKTSSQTVMGTFVYTF